MFTWLTRMANEPINLEGSHPFERRLAESWPPRQWCDTHVVLAVSGGADGAAMLRATVALKKRHGGRGQVYIGHLNHGLRGDAADADAGWVKALCERLDLPCEVGRADVAVVAEHQGD